MSGLEGVYYERPPFRCPNLGDHDTTMESVTRFIGKQLPMTSHVVFCNLNAPFTLLSNVKLTFVKYHVMVTLRLKQRWLLV